MSPTPRAAAEAPHNVCQPLLESGWRGVERLLAAVRGEDDGPLEERLAVTRAGSHTSATRI